MVNDNGGESAYRVDVCSYFITVLYSIDVWYYILGFQMLGLISRGYRYEKIKRQLREGLEPAILHAQYIMAAEHGRVLYFNEAVTPVNKDTL